MWVGSDLPNRVHSIIDNNKAYTQDYDVKIWTEHNLPQLNRFSEIAYQNKNWAFVSDYVRFIALQKYGGIYLDTDQKLLKNIDDLREWDFFAGWNKDKSFIYTGIIGCVPQLPFIQRILEEYDSLNFSKQQSSPKILTRCFNEKLHHSNFKIYDSSYFYPVQAGEKDKGRIFEHTYATHLWDESWVKFVGVRRFLRKIGFISLFHFIRKYISV